MKMELYTIKDIKVPTYHTIWEAPNEAVAIRNFTTAAQDPASDLNKWPADYELWKVGSIDTDTGVIAPEQTYIWKASDCIRKED